MSEEKIVKIFWVGSRMCIVYYVDHRHNGYVESKFKKDYTDYPSWSEGPTYSGNLYGIIEDKWFIGFDTNHTHDTEESQSLERVIERTREFAKDIIIAEDDMK